VATSGSRRAILSRSVLAMISAPTIEWGPTPVAPPRPLTRSGLAFACGIPSG
jgi:hypothetical protein